MSTGPKIKIHGIRQRVPSGYLVGRTDPGGGDPQLVSLKELAQQLVRTGVIRRTGAGTSGTAGTTFIQKDCGDETTAITAGTGKKTFRMPGGFTLGSVRASLTTAQATDGGGGIFTVDVQQNGTSIFSTLLTIDNAATTSVGATTPPVLANADLADDDEMRIDVTQIGDGTAAGLKVTLLGTAATATVAANSKYFGRTYFGPGYFGVYA